MLTALCQMQEDGPASGAFLLSNPVTPALQAFPRVSNTYGSYQVWPMLARPGPARPPLGTHAEG